MATDAAVTADLMETLEDGRDGFASAAEKLKDTSSSHLASEFQALSDERARFYTELENLAAAYGDDLDESGSVAASVHRAWMSVKDTLSGSDPDGVLGAAETGEKHAVSEYEKALAEDISPGLRDVVQRQLTDIKAALGRVQGLKAS